jgi:hypothetical protein
MIWFKYTSLTTNEVFEKITYISLNPYPWVTFVIISLLSVFLIINYIFPAILFSVEHIKKEHLKKERKSMIRQIVLQKDVEDEIESSFIKR